LAEFIQRFQIVHNLATPHQSHTDEGIEVTVELVRTQVGSVYLVEWEIKSALHQQKRKQGRGEP
jgi:hypothetical protein